MIRTSEVSRINGLQYPPNLKQTVAFTFYLIVSASYFLFVGAFFIGLRQYILLIVGGILTLSALICWYWTIKTNPGESEGDKKFTKPPIIRYCSSCNKHVHGMDHHCVWLNNCIGAKNYNSFYAMLWLGLAQMTLQTVVGVLFHLHYFQRCEDHIQRIFHNLETVIVLVCIFTVLSGVLGLCMAILTVFHTYLILVAKQSTYEWIMNRRSKAKGERPGDIHSSGGSQEESMNSVMIENRRMEIEQFQKASSWQAHMDRRFNDSTKYVPQLNNKNSIFHAYREHEKESMRIANSGRIRPADDVLSDGGSSGKGCEVASDHVPVDFHSLNTIMGGGSERTLANEPVSTRSTDITMDESSRNGDDRTLESSFDKPTSRKPQPLAPIKKALTKKGLGSSKIAVVSNSGPLEISTQQSISVTATVLTQASSRMDEEEMEEGLQGQGDTT